MNNTVPFFSIVIPTYNHAHFIKRCLDSILNQSYLNWEAIVVNNFSEDNTIEIVEGYKDPRVRLINNANNGIIGVSRNKGIAEAKGEWICFLDSDDWWYPHKLEVTLKNLENYDFLYHDLDIYTNTNKSNRIIKARLLKDDIAVDLLVNGNAIPNSSVSIRKSIIDVVGKISEDNELVAVEDLDYWIRIAQITVKFNYINESLGAYWIGNGNISFSEKQILTEEALFDKYKHLLDSKETQIAIKTLALRKARIFHRLGKMKEARKEYIKSITILNNKKKLKSIVGLVASLFRIKL